MANSQHKNTNYQQLIANSLKKIQKQKEEISKLQAKSKEKIAIVGMGCRFPGADNIEEFWQLLKDGQCHIGSVPEDRWRTEQFYDQDEQASGKVYTKAGGFLSDINHFDNDIFGIVPREASCMDPQHRVLLEVSWSALENAGIPASTLKNTLSGVYLGIMNQDNAQFSIEQPDTIEMYTASGNGLGIAAGRLSHSLGLKGPSLSVDTNCSSSLTSIHMAAQGLLNGECDLALAGGVNMMVTPAMTIIMCKAKALSPSGVCSSFDEKADGYVRGEGAGIIVLKRLSDAKAAKDNILGIISASAINHDGRSSALPVPNGTAQRSVIEEALNKAEITADQVSYIESHGTGTPLGDPIEIEAIAMAYQRNSTTSKKLTVGAVKPNIGHLESAAGIASIIKVLLMFKHQKIPGNIHFETPNPKMNIENTSIDIPKSLADWDSNESRFAGVSAFGFCGANSHIILSDQHNADLEKVKDHHHKQALFTLSAKTEEALNKRLNQYKTFITQHQDSIDLHQLCFSTNTGSDDWDWRYAVSVGSVEELLDHLSSPSYDYVHVNTGGRSSDLIANLYTKIDSTKTENTSLDYLANLHHWLLHHPSAYKLFVNTCEYLKQQDKDQFKAWPDSIDWSNELQLTVAAAVFPALWLTKLNSFGIKIHSINAEKNSFPLLTLATKILPFKQAVEFVYHIALSRKKYLSGTDFSLGTIESILGKAKQSPSIQTLLDGNEITKKSYTVADCLNICREMIESSSNPVTHITFDEKTDDSQACSIHPLEAGSIQYVTAKLMEYNYLRGSLNHWGEYYKDSETQKLSLPPYPLARNYFSLPTFKPKNAAYGLTVEPDAPLNYKFEWQAYHATEGTDLSDHIVIFADKLGQVIPLINEYKEQGCSITLIVDGEIPTLYKDCDVDCHSLASSEGMSECLKTICNDNNNVSLVFAWALDIRSPQFSNNSQQQLITDVLEHLSVLVTQSINMKLWLLTTHSVSIPGLQNQYHPAQSAISGMAKSIALEYPELWGGQIDLDSISEHQSASIVAKLCRGTGNETQFALRQGSVYVPRIAPEKNTSNVKISFNTSAAYIVTGGLGALGLSVAKWLVDHGANNIILLGRSDESSLLSKDTDGHLQEKLQKLRETANHVQYLSVDISDIKALTETLSRVANDFSGIDGIFHAAGINHITPLQDLTRESIQSTLSAKVDGTWNLHLLSLQLSPTYFVMFSSIAAAWGSGGMSAYAAANSYMDGMAFYRNSLALPAVVINWGPWAESGMATTDNNAELAKKAGLVPMAHNVALAQLEKALVGRKLHSIVTDIDTTQFINVMEFRRPLPMFDTLKALDIQKDSNDQVDTQLVQILKDPDIDGDKKRDLIVNSLKDFVATSLGIDVDNIETNIPLMNMGIDSLTAFEVSSNVKKQLQVELPITEILKGATIVDLASHLANELTQTESRSQEKPSADELCVVEGEI